MKIQNVSSGYYGLFGGLRPGGTIKNLNVVGDLSGSTDLGGIVGRTLGASGKSLSITGCTFSGTITSTNALYGCGGIVGYHRGYASVSNCANNGTITGTKYTGGIIGYDISTDGLYGLHNCYNSGTITGTGDVGSIVGYHGGGSVRNCFYLEGTAEKGIGNKNDSNSTAVVKTAEQFKSGEIAVLLRTGYERGEAWGQNLGSDDFPRPYGAQTVYKVSCGSQYIYSNTNTNYALHDYTNGKCARCGFEPYAGTTDTYSIATADELFAFASIVNGGKKNANAVLTADINLENKSWTPICATGLYWNGYGSDLGYSGTFDGQGYTISNLKLENSAAADASCGLFGTVSGTIKNLGIDGMTFTDNKQKDFRVGAIAGQLIKSTGHITNCYAKSVNIPENDRVAGGIAGCVYEGTIENCMVYNSDIHGLIKTGSNEYRYGYIVGDCRGDNSTTDRQGSVINCYTDGKRVFSTQTGHSDRCEAQVTAARFKSGEIACLLRGDQTGIWGQSIGTDQYPTLTGAPVYNNVCVKVHFYSNTNAGVRKQHAYNTTGICSNCGYDPGLTQDSDGVYVISNADQLAAFAGVVNDGTLTDIRRDARLTNDIDLSTVCGESIGSWRPIGEYGGVSNQSVFRGNFDGQGHTVSNLYINKHDTEYQGLFGRIQQTNDPQKPAIVIKNLSVSGSVYGYESVGGIAGGVISNNTDAAYTITIENCSFSGTVNGSYYLGGIAGYMGTRNVIVKNCCSIGCAVTSAKSRTETGTPTNCYYLNGDSSGKGTAKSAEEFRSGAVAYLLRGGSNTASSPWGQKLGTDEYPRLNAAAVYSVNCVDRPCYSNTNKNETSHNFVNGYCTRCGAPKPPESVSGVYQIKTPEQLKWFADYVNSGNYTANAKLMNDIDLSGICGEGNNWTPIGSRKKDDAAMQNIEFDGIFDGGGYTVSGLYIYTEDQTYPRGLFGYTETNAVIKNLNVSGSVAAGICAGGIAGENNGTVTGCTFSGNSSGTGNKGCNHIGGITGRNRSNGTITNCYNKAAVTGDFDIGGIAGENYGTVLSCYNIGEITIGKGSTCGGIVGSNSDNGIVTNCYYHANTAPMGIGDINTADVPGQAESKSAAQFASGEVAYLLRGSDANSPWGQRLSGDTIDPLPELNGVEVYYLYTDCIHQVYTNDLNDGTAEPQAHEFGEDRICTICGGANLDQDDQGRYLIGTAVDMKAFASMVNSGKRDANAVLTANIDLANEPWTTICETALYHQSYGNDDGYTGTFDGANYTISNLALQSSGTMDASCGLFGTVSGTIKNLHIEGATLTKDGGKDMRTGVIVGQLIKTGRVENCMVSKAMITPGEHVVGGIAGCVYEGTIENCLVAGSQFSGTNNRYGHIVGDTRSDNKDRYGTVRNCYTDASPACSTQSGTIENCVEGISVERFQSGEIAVLLQGEQETTVWGQKLGTDAYPTLSSENRVYFNYTDCIHREYSNSASSAQTPLAHNYVDGACTVCGMDSEGRFVINTTEKMIEFAARVNNGEIALNAVLTADISVSTDSGFVPIGTSDKPYTGKFDGQNHTLTVNISGSENTAAPFSYATNATICNLMVDGTITASGKYAAGFVSQPNGVTLTNCLSKVTIDSSVNGDGTHGGLIGVANGTTTITNCGFTGAINGSQTNSCGGFVGWTDKSGTTAITNSYVAGTFGISSTNGDTFSRNSGYVTLTNCYYLTMLNSVNSGAEQLTAEQFNSGEAAYKLNGSTTEGAWKQNIGTDDYPNFTGLAVYYKADTAKYYNITGDVAYTNTVLKKIEASDTKDGSTATAVLSEIDTKGNTIKGITWSYTVGEDTYSVKYDKTEISGESTVFFGIVVPALLDAAEENETKEITVTID